MNKIYKVIWSKVRNCYVAVSEIAKRNSKSCTSVHCGAKAGRTHTGLALSSIVGVTLLAGVCSVLLPVRAALAAPVMPTLDYRGASPDVTIATTTSNTTASMEISSTQANNVLKWIDFSVGKGGAVNFTDSHNYLNYVTGHGRSEIDGVLQGKGSIYLINPNGILFGSTARVDVGSLYLSTRRLTDQQLASYDSGVAALFGIDSAAVGDVINLGKLNADLIQVEGKNITFKNVADVTKGGTLKDGDITGGKAHFEAADGSVTLTVNNETGNEGEIHLGFAVGVDGTLNGSAAEGVSAGQYTNVTVPDFAQTSNHSFNHWMTNITPTHYMLVRNGYELQNMQNNLTETNGTKMPGNYMLANDIDLQRDVKSFQPIGYKNNSNQEFVFEGKFDGLNYKINDLKIDTSGLSSDKNVACGIGLFGINAGTVENVGVESNIAVDKPDVGGIVGINKGTIRNVYHTGSVIGNGDVGGIAGHNESGASIKLAYNTGKITAGSGCSNVGGIAGVNEGTIAQVYNTGEVGDGNTGNNVGGIAGKLAGASAVPGETYNAIIEDAYNYNTDSSSTAPLITGSSNVGGIVGLVEGNSSDQYLVRNTYNTGIVSANNNSGGIIGNVSSAGSGNPTVNVISSYFSEGTPNEASGGTENQKTTAQLQNINTFNNWSISAAGGAGKTWRIYEGQTMPLLTAFLKTKDLVRVYEYDGSPHSVPKNDPLLDDPDIKKSDQFAGNWDNYTDSLTDTGVVNILKQNQVFLYSLQNGYDIADMKLIVQPKALTATFADISKTYDGTNAATLTLDTLTGVVDADKTKLTVSTTSATYSDKNAGENKTVTYAGLKLSGDKAENYVIKADGTGKGTISPKQLTVTFADISKTYDGTTNDVNEMGYVVASRTGTLSGLVKGDESKVSVSGKATYADKNVSNSYSGPDKTVYYSGLALGAGNDGDESANYVLASTTMTVANNGRIDKANVTLTAKDVTKTYDGTTEVTGGTLVEYSGAIFASDSLSGGKFAFTDKNAGDGNKTVTVESGSARITDKATGADTSGNYNITYEDNKKSTINKADVTLTAEDVEKTYDGTTDVAEASRKLIVKSGTIFTGDSASGGVFAFADKNEGENKTVTVSGATISDGTNSGNYNITYENNTTSTINKANVTLTAEDVEKTYDGTTNVAEASRKLKVQSGTIFTGDSVSGGVFAFADKNAGTGKVVTVSGATISDGTNSGNYNITYENNTTSIINKADVTLTAENVEKTYDGTTDVAVASRKLKVKSGTIFTGDSASGGVFAFEDKNAGENKTVTVSGATISDGTNSGNYNITYENNTTSTITPKAITATFAAISKTYDGTNADTEASRTGTLKGVEAVDDGKVSVSASAAYDKKDAGSRTVNYTGVALSGDEANNYSIATTATGAGTIDRKAITATFADVSKTYDGTTEATAGAGTLNTGDVIRGDDVSLNESGITAVYDDKNAGDGKTVNYTGIALSGTDANNYSIAPTATGTGTIYRKALELAADSVTIHEGGAMPATFTGSVTGFVAGETIGSGDTLRFALSDPSATAPGSYAVTGTLNGRASGNYGLNYTFSNAASNANAFVIVAKPKPKPASVEDMTVSDLIPAAKGTAAEDIRITEVDNAMEQASDKQAGAAAAFTVAQGILPVDRDRGSSFENSGMKQPSSMTPEEVAEQVNARQENAGVLNAAMDVVRKTDDTIGTEESKRKEAATENE